MAFYARLKSARLTGAKEGKENSREEIVGEKPSMLVVQIELDDPDDETVALVARLARTPQDVKVDLSSYQLLLPVMEAANG